MFCEYYGDRELKGLKLQLLLLALEKEGSNWGVIIINIIFSIVVIIIIIAIIIAPRQQFFPTNLVIFY